LENEVVQVWKSLENDSQIYVQTLRKYKDHAMSGVTPIVGGVLCFGSWSAQPRWTRGRVWLVHGDTKLKRHNRGATEALRGPDCH